MDIAVNSILSVNNPNEYKIHFAVSALTRRPNVSVQCLKTAVYVRYHRRTRRCDPVEMNDRFSYVKVHI